MTDFEGKIALITGAGGGLGRHYAVALAKRGAKVVVNDLGTNRHGEGEAAKMADAVVDEITGAGGEAVADYGSVADPGEAAAMVERAYEEFGGLDIVINNAGILRDKTLVKMEKDMWDAVMEVHLKGTFLVTRQAVRRMTEADTAGRIVNTTSYAGLKGNFGQTNYGAAKAGIAGFTRSLALEGQKYGVEANCIAPIAKTRMTDDIDMVPEEYDPSDVVPLVLWLCSEEAAGVTGRVFGAHGHHYFEYHMETTPGVELDEPWTVEQVGERFDAITEPESAGDGEAEGGGQVRELFAMLPEVFDADAAGGWSASIAFVVEGTGTYGVEVAEGSANFVDGAPDTPDGEVTFDGADTILDLAAGELSPEKAFMGGKISADNMGVLMKFGDYFDLEAAGQMAAGAMEDDGDDDVDTGPGPNPEAVGNKFKPSARFVKPEEMVAYAKAVDDENPRYLGEDGTDPEVGAPLLAVRPLFEALEDALSDRQLDADLINLVHGEQQMELFDVLRPWDLVAPRAEIESIEEKSSGWLVDVRQWLMRDGEKVAEATSGLFIRNPEAEKSDDSDADADADDRSEPMYTEQQTVADDQPMRYAKASGDMNPIHTDPQVAEAAGLPDVILHGLCTMAFAARAVVDGLLDGEVERLARINVRFASPVFPGDELTTRIWEGDEADWEFEMVNADGDEVLTMGEADAR